MDYRPTADGQGCTRRQCLDNKFQWRGLTRVLQIRSTWQPLATYPTSSPLRQAEDVENSLDQQGILLGAFILRWRIVRATVVRKRRGRYH